jgi:quercetin dioxygenase-like cupin family protein/uncharacterized protein YndB with AHSA1/START domain
MARAGDVLEIPELGVRIEFRRTTAETDGEVLEADIVGNAHGFIAQAHVHPHQAEHLKVISGRMELKMNGSKRVLGPGEDVLTPPGTPHRHRAVGEEPGRVRITLRPAGRTEEWLERLAQLSRDGQISKRGFPRPVAGARTVLGFEGEGHAAFPSAAAQRRLARTIVALFGRRGRRAREYVFVDEWDVAAPPDAVFAALADTTTYPLWWTPVYLEATAGGPAGVGQVSEQHFKGRLPYTLKTTSRTVRHDAPHILEADVTGDLTGHGTWILTPDGDGTHVRFDWVVTADRPLLRYLTPVLRPAFRWNHNWAIARAMEGLEPYAQQLAANRQASAAGVAATA